MRQILSKVGDEYTCPVAIINRDGKILLGLRNYTADKWKDISVWTCPGGRCDPGETIEETLRREVLEETGINDLNIIEFLGEVPGAKEGDNVYLFHCSTEQECRLMEPEKFSEWKWIKPEEAPDNYVNKDSLELILKSNK
ncbi:hypothetical protein COB64_02440 [Candidatus Wolfebacteria bacterium]|nr:MAG: hypothetical protein COB64_02440 [Candidatus Wolfebacteria bacterium]